MFFLIERYGQKKSEVVTVEKKDLFDFFRRSKPNTYRILGEIDLGLAIWHGRK